ncbi:GNAT family N-acetyltransferase [uncultured Microbacterium sp.]|uniref:GNAT family N-acetyltransferase n=1 Tax=uncultured Microbacterium sp. TaxID=191216 RepID=UPI00338E94BA
MTHVETRLRDLGCPKVNLQVRAGNAQVVDFYRRLGYEIDDTVDLGKRLIPDLKS